MINSRLLTINTGSSGLKAGLYTMGAGEQLDLSVEATRVGQPGSMLRITLAGQPTLERPVELADHAAALACLLDWLRQEGHFPVDAVGHRVVHGGRDHREPELVTPALLASLQALVPVDPLHLPQALAAIAALEQACPGIRQVACFDTAFHRHMPRVAQMYALPRELDADGVIRYGFHGLSYEYIMQALHTQDPKAIAGRVIIAHLGNGASMAAVQAGIGIDTTMGFSPSGGLVMGTRTGDLDPGALLYLLRTRAMTHDQLETLVNRQSGLLGVSGTSPDMRDLLARESQDTAAAEAVALFCYQAKKSLGALAATLGGLDTLVFTGGMGEHAAPVRARICEGLEFLGVELDAERNAAHAPLISRQASRVRVRVIATDEDLMIARHTHEQLQQGE